MNDSVKDSEMIRRCNCSPADLNQVSAETKLPVVMDTFWASTTNKIKLQDLFKDYILNIPKPMTMGISNEAQPYKGIFSNNNTTTPVVDAILEDTNVKIIPHAFHAICSRATRVIILST